MPDQLCYRIPEGVSYQRWDGIGEWVVFHSGTGETLRLSDAALVVLDALAARGPQTARALAQTLAELTPDAHDAAELLAATQQLLRGLTTQECVDEVVCPNSAP